MSKTADLNKKLEAAYNLGILYETFQHYKGGIYTISDMVIDTDDGNVRVLYYRVAGPEYDAEAEVNIRFVRKLDEFLGALEDGTPRFRQVQMLQSWVPVDKTSVEE